MRIYKLNQAKGDLPRRHRGDNKTKGGRCLVIAGSRATPGAALLCGEAAYRLGAGYVYIFSNYRNRSLPADFLPLQKLQDIKAKKISAVVIGPGLKSDKFIGACLKYLIKAKLENVVVDAEALNYLARHPQKLPSNWILTPHEGELARMLGVSSDKIRQNRQWYLFEAQAKFACCVLLKGFGTLVSDGQSHFKIASGGPVLAKAGTGDILSGMILALLAQGHSVVKAACLGAFLHGLTADYFLSSGRDVLSLMARDLIDELPFVIAQVRKS